MIGYLSDRYCSARTIHLVLDNLNTHGPKSLVDCFGQEEGRRLWQRFTIHYTPKHGSWLNQAEIELSLYSRQCLGTRRFLDLGFLQRETTAWNRQTDRKGTTINWKFTRRKARKTFRYEMPARRGRAQ